MVASRLASSANTDGATVLIAAADSISLFALSSVADDAAFTMIEGPSHQRNCELNQNLTDPTPKTRLLSPDQGRLAFTLKAHPTWPLRPGTSIFLCIGLLYQRISFEHFRFMKWASRGVFG
jgi:hypothetical protein